MTDNHDDDTVLVPTRPRGGRPKGALNKVTKEAAAIARAIITDDDYLATLYERAMSGTLGPMEPMLWAYGFGKPKEDVVLPGEIRRDLADMTTDELLARLDHLKRQLVEHDDAIDDAIDVTPVPTKPEPLDTLGASREGATLTSETVATVVVNEPPPAPEPSGDSRPSAAVGVRTERTTESIVAAPPIECPFCHKPLADCADLRAKDLDLYEVLHYDAPEFVEQRQQRATAEMYESLRRHGPARY